MPSRFALLAGSIFVALPLTINAQSLNVDFGNGASTPAATYDAAGSVGTWNCIGVLQPFVRVPLVNSDGSSTGVEIYMFGGTQLLEVDIPETTGDDAALMDDMLIGFNDPVDVCIWVTGLANDAYEVLTYALTPGDPGNLSPARVDFATPGPTNVGGTWPGIHAEKTTFARHTLTITNGRIALHSGTYNGGPFQSGINGIQIRPRSPSAAPDLHGSRVLGVYPNPARTPQRIEFSLHAPSQGTVEITDVAGRIVWRQLFAHAPGRHTIEWRGTDTAGRALPAAVYFVRLRDARQDLLATQKLLRLN